MESRYPLPTVCWLKVTDYMHGWLTYELGGEVKAHGKRVLSVQHLDGARKILRMETVDDMMDKMPLGNAISATRRNCYDAAIILNEDVMKTMWNVTREDLELFMPIECPKMRLTKYGVLRPWTLDSCFGKSQARLLQNLLREEFWKAVGEFDAKYAEEQDGRKYPAREMIEEFCAETETPDMYVDTIRREWQRRQKRQNG